ncbi:MAG: hypothetical protein ACKN9V_05705 [Pseudomonadota bacterium]
MNRHILLGIIPVLVSQSLFAQTELTMKKFRFTKHSSANFERLVLEFSGPEVKEDVEIKESMVGADKDISIAFRNAQLVGAVPENTLNESLKGSRKWFGPLSFSMDMPKNGFSLRTLLNNPEAKVDAFWLANPTRLVVDVFAQNSPRANSRDVLEAKRSVASHPKAKPMPQRLNEKAPTQSEPIFCFPSSAKMSAAVAYSPWKGSSTIPMEVKDPSSAQNDMQEGIVCYPAQSRVHPQINFGSVPANAENHAAAATGAELPRTIANEAEKAPQFDPNPKTNVPPSLGVNFEKVPKGADPASLLPPYR